MIKNICHTLQKFSFREVITDEMGIDFEKKQNKNEKIIKSKKTYSGNRIENIKNKNMFKRYTLYKS